MLQWLYKLDHLYGLLLTFGLALIIEGVARNYYGSAGLPYQMPEVAARRLRTSASCSCRIYRAWVIVPSLVVCLGTWFVIERTKLGAYLRAATENPTLVRAFGINVPRMITLTYGFGVALAALRRRDGGADLQCQPADGLRSDHRGVRRGGDRRHGLDHGRDRHGLRARRDRGPDQGVFPGSVQHRDLRHHGDRAAGAAGRPVRAEPPDMASASTARPPPQPRTLPQPPVAAARCREPQRDHRVSDHGGGAGGRAVLHLSAVPDAGAVLCAVRLRVQPADRLWRAAVVRPRALFRLGELSGGAFRQGLGLPAGARDPHRRRHRCGARPDCRYRSRSAGRASISR